MADSHKAPDPQWRMGVAGTRALNWADAAFERTRGARPWPDYDEPGMRQHALGLVYTLLELTPEQEALARHVYDEAKRWYEKRVAEKR